MRRLLLSLLLLPLAGCVEPLDRFVYEPLPPPPPGLGPDGLSLARDVAFEHLEFTIDADDGIALAADVWKPAENGTFPVVLIQSPYFEGDKDSTKANWPSGDLYRRTIQEFVPRGYAVALVDLRGTRLSDGCLDLGGPGERADAVRVVEFLGEAAWSSGRVGMIGASYDGWTQQMAAAGGAPHLAAIVPIAPVADWYHVVGKGGAKYAGWTPGSPYGYNFGIGFALPPQALPPHSPDDPRVRRADDQACAVENQLWSDDPSGDYNEWMRARDLRPAAPEATAAMFYVHGFADVNARPDHVDPWLNAYGGPKRAFLWQAAHTAPDAGNTGRGEVWWREVIRWFDHHLLGLQNGVDATHGVFEVQDSRGRWRIESAWPPEDARPLELLLAPGTLTLPNGTPPPRREASAALPVPLPAIVAGDAQAVSLWRDDPDEDGAQLGARSVSIGKGSTLSRLVFASAPLPQDVHYAGRPVLRAFVETDRPNTLVVARLYEILEDGSWVLLNRGVQSLRHRGGPDAPQPVVPGEVYEVEVAMQPNDHVFRKGRGIGLALTSSDASYVLPSGTMAVNRLHHGPSTPSALVLPAIERSGFTFVSWGKDQPPWLGPRAWEVSS